eukprot:scpid106711/ scgid12869/ 
MHIKHGQSTSTTLLLSFKVARFDWKVLTILSNDGRVFIPSLVCVDATVGNAGVDVDACVDKGEAYLHSSQFLHTDSPWTSMFLVWHPEQIHIGICQSLLFLCSCCG